MGNEEHLSILEQGTAAWNTWRPSNHQTFPDLSYANLSFAKLSGINFHSADLSGANLFRADLSFADLSGANLNAVNLKNADLYGANLSTARLIGARLVETNLTGANLSNANLVTARLTGSFLIRANLTGADLSESLVGYNAFGNTTLAETKGLESCYHRGPSFLDYGTLSKSRHLPLNFLRGCGLPEEYIHHLPSLFGDALQFNSCFISHSSKDTEFAQRVYADLQHKGVRCWFAPHDIQGGRKIDEQLDEAIRVYDRLLLILSEASMNSEWVKTEIAYAREKEIKQKRRVLFPISLVEYARIREWKCFDGDRGKDSAREIREYFIPDFSDWKLDRDSYSKAFERLVRDLKAEQSTKAS